LGYSKSFLHGKVQIIPRKKMAVSFRKELLKWEYFSLVVETVAAV